MAYDGEHIEGFDKYGPVNQGVGLSEMAGDWSNITNVAGSGYNISSLVIAGSLEGPGQSIHITMGGGGSGGGSGVVYEALPANYARSVGTYYFLSNLNQPFGIFFLDGIQTQVVVGVQAVTGRPAAWRNDPANNGAVLLGTASTAVIANTIQCLQWDITIHNTAGIVKLWLNGALVMNLTGQNTRVTGNNFFNAYGPGACTVGGTPGNWFCDHLWAGFYIASGGTDPPPLTNAIVETSYPISDGSTVNFTPGPGVLGSLYSNTGNTNAPGANQLALRKWTPVVNCTLDSVVLWSTVNNTGAKFKPAVYADSAGAPAALLTSGPEVVGAVASAMTLTLTTPQTLTAGTPIWLGYITDTSIALAQNDTGTLGYKAANTYASGAPNPAPTMTSGQPSWGLYGNITAAAHNWAQVSDPYGNNLPLFDNSYNTDGTVNDEDLFNFAALAGTPANIYTACVKAFTRLDSAGAHTVNLVTKSGATSGNGSNTGWSPSPTTYAWIRSFFDNDPNTSAPWASAAALNAASSGYEIAS